jgi:V8-like Glu-specific endopeptidase
MRNFITAQIIKKNYEPELGIMNSSDNNIKNTKSRIYRQEEHMLCINGPTNDIQNFEDVIKTIQSNVEKLSQLSKAVMLIDNSKKSPATGFLIAQNLLMTNWHIFEKAHWAKGAIAKFGYLEEDKNPNDDIDPYESFKIDPEIYFFNNEELDFAVVGINENPGITWGKIPFPATMPGKTPEKVIIIQHPFGRPMQITITNNKVIEHDQRKIMYEADTENGSSGSPVLDENFNLVALHHGWEYLPGKTDRANAGSLISAIQEDFPNRLNHLLSL